MTGENGNGKMKSTEPTPAPADIFELVERNYFDAASRRVIHRRITNISGRVKSEAYIGVCVLRVQLEDGRVMRKDEQFTINAKSVGEAFHYYDRDLKEYEKKKTAELTKPPLVDAAGQPIRSKPRSVIGGDGRMSRQGHSG